MSKITMSKHYSGPITMIYYYSCLISFNIIMVTAVSRLELLNIILPIHLHGLDTYYYYLVVQSSSLQPCVSDNDIGLLGIR